MPELRDGSSAATTLAVRNEQGKAKSSSGERREPIAMMGDGQVTVIVTTGTGDSPGEHLLQIVDEGLK